MGQIYLQLGDVTGLIPGPFLVEALDDNGDGQADPAVVQQILQDASDAVDGIIGGRYTVPLSNPIPAIAHTSAKYFAVEFIYKRRGKEDQNPYKKNADDARALLAEVAAGTKPLDPNVQRAQPSATAVTKPAATKPQGTVNA